MSFLTLDDVTYSYRGAEPTLSHVSWQIREGEFQCLLGRSGCGKTTLLKLAAGLLQPQQGHVYLADKEVLTPSPKAGFVFQSPTLLEWKSVIDNVLLPVSLRRKPTEEDQKRAEYLLEVMGLSLHKDKYPSQLSGGQQSRVAIARALIDHPAMLFLDEPFAALDAITREDLQDDLLKICHMHKITVLFITHDIAEAVYLADKVAVMADGSITYESAVQLPKPRAMEMRYDASFNQLCLKVRRAMNGGRE